MMGLSSTSNLCMCVFVIFFVISERLWIVGVMSFQKIYDLIGLIWWCNDLLWISIGWNFWRGRTAVLLEVLADLKPKNDLLMISNNFAWIYMYVVLNILNIYHIMYFNWSSDLLRLARRRTSPTRLPSGDPYSQTFLPQVSCVSK